MKKNFLLALLLVNYLVLFATSVNSASEYISCISAGGITELEFELPEYTLMKERAEGLEYDRIETILSGEYAEPGSPAVPCFSTLVAVPDQGKIEFEIINQSQKELPNINLYPRQELQSESRPPERVFVKNEQIYGSSAPYPGAAATCSEPVIMRDYRLVRVTFNPFQYEPASRRLVVNESISIRVFAGNEVGNNEIRASRRPSRAFSSLYKNTVINYEEMKREEEYQKPSILYIYYNDSTVEDYLDYLVAWRREKGYEVTVVSTSETGNSTVLLHNYIQAAYDEWENPPEYVCLVGDANGSYSIPCYYVDSGETDNNFVMLSGNDVLPDAAIGRLPFTTTTELATIITKTLHYEKEPYMTDPNWFMRGLMVGDPTTSGTTCVDSKLYVEEMMGLTAPAVEPIEVFSGGFASAMSSNINQGCLYFNYRGFGDFSGWSTNAIDQLTNGWKLPAMVFLTCGSGNYASGYDSFSERFLKAGTSTNPKGGVAAISTSTSMTHTTFNNCMDMGIWSGVFVDETWNMALGLSRGKLNMFNTFPGNPCNHTNQFIAWNNLMGDPALELWSDVPQELSVTAAGTVNPAAELMEVQVFCEGYPVENAWVTALDLYGESNSVYSESSGSAWLPLEGLHSGNLTLTVSGHNYIPEQAVVLLTSNYDYISMSMEVLDPGGNNNGEANPGEEIELEITLANTSEEVFCDLTLSASSPLEGVDLTTDMISIPELGANEVLTCSVHLQAELANTLTGLENLTIDLHLSDTANSWSQRLEEAIYAPCLLLDHYELANPDFSPGESSDMVVYLHNAGNITASSVNISLVSTDLRLNVVDSTAFCGMIPAGSTGNNISAPFHIIAENTIVPGTQIPLYVNISTPELNHPAIEFLLTVGSSSAGDPLGPDAGGYFCYDQTDINYVCCPEYDWVEIAPDEGGSGTELNLYDGGNTGDVASVPIPINFRFYGIEYDDISICSNGWISPGITSSREFMNGPVPAPGGPNPMIAAFWDDLMTTYGSVSYYHNPLNHTFIVEWNDLRIDYSTSNVTFEAIIYDADFYPTSSGNSDIKIQYAEFNNDDLGSYGGFYVYHGQFATIGIENGDSSQGLQYTYNNQYPSQAMPLEDESAILFSSSPLPLDQAYLVCYEDEIIDSGADGQLDYAETAELKISLANLGQEAAYEISVIAQLEDPYVDLVIDTAVYEDIAGGTNGLPDNGFSIEIAADCPDQHEFSLELTINYNGISPQASRSFSVNAPDLQASYVFISNDENENNLPDPGESFDLGLVISNTGGSAVYNPEISTVSLSPDLLLGNSVNQLSWLPAGQNAYVVYHSELDVSAELGDYIELETTINGSYEFAAELDYDLRVGLAMEDFESGDFSHFDWEMGGAADFFISTQSHEGIYSAQSGDIGNNQYIWLSLDVYAPQNDEISFWLKVSSEGGWDYVRFYIDGAEQDAWSGEVNWYEYDYFMAAGNHELEWRYEKDAIVSGGSDCFWLDDITFPCASGTTPQALLYNQSSYDFELSGEESALEEIVLYNISEDLAQYDIRIESGENDWLELTPESGFVSPADSTVIILECLPQELPSGDYQGYIIISDNFGQDNTITVNLTYTSDSEEHGDVLPQTVCLRAFPNPFYLDSNRSLMDIDYSLPDDSEVEISVYNIRGQKVADLVKAWQTAGNYTVSWDLSDKGNPAKASGIYFTRIKASGKELFNKLVIIK